MGSIQFRSLHPLDTRTLRNLRVLFWKRYLRRAETCRAPNRKKDFRPEKILIFLLLVFRQHNVTCKALQCKILQVQWLWWKILLSFWGLVTGWFSIQPSSSRLYFSIQIQSLNILMVHYRTKALQIPKYTVRYLNNTIQRSMRRVWWSWLISSSAAGQPAWRLEITSVWNMTFGSLNLT